MPIPDYQTVMLPLLKFAADGAEQPFREAVEKLAEDFGLTGTQTIFDDIRRRQCEPGKKLLWFPGRKPKYKPTVA